jgi:hypothetical protein
MSNSDQQPGPATSRKRDPIEACLTAVEAISSAS